MKKVIKDIRSQPITKVYKNEEHVRLSLVARICQKLGWNIWNPAEFNTELQVEKLQGSNGEVDIALFLPEENSDAAQVFIETKRPGKLMPELKKCERQLVEYFGCHNTAISILTDGRIWRFYLPSLRGTFRDRLFAQVNLEEDDIDTLVTFFKNILHRDSFVDGKAEKKAKEMFEELRRIRMVQEVKMKAEEQAEDSVDTKFRLAWGMLRKKGLDIDEKEIEKLWDKKIPLDSDQGLTTNGVSSAETASNTGTKATSTNSADFVYVRINDRSLKAKGRYHIKNQTLTLFRDSEVKANDTPSLPQKYGELKKEMIKKGNLKPDPSGTKYVLTDDYEFNRPSPASSIVLGRSSNGFNDWIDDNNKKLGEYR